MPQMGFFDLSDRYASLDARRDPLVEIDAVVPWEEFRPTLERVWRKPAWERKSRAGRKPMDAVLMFKTLVLSALYNLSDDQIGYQVRDRLSFMRFPGLGLEGVCLTPRRSGSIARRWRRRVWWRRCSSSLTAIWRGRATLRAAGRSWMSSGHAPLVQACPRGIVPVPRNHNTRDENKAGEVPEDWADKPAKRSQKDTDARWTKTHGKSYYGYKNHVNVGRRHKPVRRYHVSDAALHDSQAVDHLLMRGNTGSGVWADVAYRSAEIETTLKAKG